MANGVVIEYGNYAPGAKEAFATSKEACVGEADFFDPSQLSSYGVSFPDYGNAAEPYAVPLDGSVTVFPNDPNTENMGFWSEAVSESDGSFLTPPTITLTASELFSAPGITLTFDTLNNIFPRSVYVAWCAGETLLHSETFDVTEPQPYLQPSTPLEQGFDKVVLAFEDLNMPNCRLKFRSIDYGYGTEFASDELRSAKVVQEINPISSEISINTFDFTIDSKSDVEYSFQNRQPLTVKVKRGSSEELVATTFVRSATRRGKHLWDIQSEDYIGLMADSAYLGGLYDGESEDSSVLSVIEEIFAAARISSGGYDLSGIADLSTEKLRGWIPVTDCRSALMQIAFACQFVVDTAGDGRVKLYRLSDTVSQSIRSDRIRQNQRFADADTVTAVELTAHEFQDGESGAATEVLYRITLADKDALNNGKDVTVLLDEPCYGLTLSGTDSATVEITTEHPNYAILHRAGAASVAGTQVYLRGHKYVHSTKVLRKENEQRLGADTENVKTINTSATLVNDDNASVVLDAAFDYLTNVKSTEMTIVDRPHGTGATFIKYGTVIYGTAKYGSFTPYIVTFDPPVNVGDLITAETEYLGIVTGRVLRSSFSLKMGVMDREVLLK